MSCPNKQIPMGPEPVLLSRKEVDGLYETFAAVIAALDTLKVDYIVTGGSLLGAIRQHSLLFCDDDIDIAIIDDDTSQDGKDSGAYRRVRQELGSLLHPNYIYSIRPWEGGDKIRSAQMSNVFVDLFTLRRFDTMEDFRNLIGIKKNGQPQSNEYVENIVNTVQTCAFAQDEQIPLCPFWHFNTRKAIEMWPKEVYRKEELFPLVRNLKFGPLTDIQGPRMPVRLLKRAFGQDCFEVYSQSDSHNNKGVKRVQQQKDKTSQEQNNDDNNNNTDNGQHLPPLILEGGLWESSKKVPLQDEHYLPIQPVARAKRRYTLHGREQLMQYLADQTMLEEAWLQESNKKESNNGDENNRVLEKRTVYMDGVFDLFHVGHLEAIRQCAQLGSRVIIGVVGDVDATGYKRPPIISEPDRVAVVQALKEVHEVVCPCPLIVTEGFMEQHGIDLVVHGFANDADAKRQEEFFEVPMKDGKFKRISYYEGLSTTDIINKIRFMPDPDEEEPTETCQEEAKQQKWFGAAISEATCNSVDIPTDPFPLSLRQVIEPHISKARKRREEALGAIRKATGESTYNAVLSRFRSSGLANEGELVFDTVLYPLRSAFLRCTGLPDSTDLSHLHENEGAKNAALYSLTLYASEFQSVFDRFVRGVCVPHMASILDCDEIYYQTFPCVRIIQPQEFSIGPHSDVAYGHHPCSVNFYLPLTEIGGTSALFLESRRGSEDWHPIVGDYGMVKHFAGAICSHWTTDNNTGLTRVSLDFRLITGSMFRELQCGGSCPGGQRDVYRAQDGYYNCCRKVEMDNGSMVWERHRASEPFTPDARLGFPWTVKDWDKLLLQKGKAKS